MLALLDDAPRRALASAVAAAERLRAGLWLVGGAVRDAALGLPLRDLDFATDGDPAALARAVARVVEGPAAVETHERFRTAAVRFTRTPGAPTPAQAPSEPYALDFAALRLETYERPGALPALRFGVTIEEDLARRDFSVNALALGLTGARRNELIDPHHGLEDLARRRLRVLHGASFRHDATRLWRGARYASRLRLRPEPGTARLISEGNRWLEPISGARLWAELERIAAERRPGAALARLEAWGALEATHHALLLTPEARRALRAGPLDPALAFAVLTAGNPERAAIADRLSASREALRAAGDATRLIEAARAVNATPALLATLESTGESGRVAARRLDLSSQRALQAALRRWERTRSPLAPGALAALGVPPGAPIGEWLRCLRARRYLGTLSTPAEAKRLVEAGLRPSTRGRTEPR